MSNPTGFQWLAFSVLALVLTWVIANLWLRFWHRPISETSGEQMDRWEQQRLSAEAARLAIRLRTILARPVDLGLTTRQELRLLVEDLEHRRGQDPDEIYRAIMILQGALPLPDMPDRNQRELRELARMVLQPPRTYVPGTTTRETPPRGGEPGIIDFHTEYPLNLLNMNLCKEIKLEKPQEPETPTIWDRLNED